MTKKKIDEYGVGSGRIRKENDQIVNIADLMEQIASGDSTGVSELYGAGVSTRPAANTVPAGSTFVVVAVPLVVYMSNGTNWIEVT